MANDCTILVFISGRGTNLKSLHQHSDDYEIIGVVSDTPDAAGLDYARAEGIDTAIFPRSDYENKQEQQHAMLAFSLIRSPHALCLAGFMQVLTSEFITTWGAPIFNIHPSLLPAYPGLHTHQRVLEAGESVHGCTVHLVDQGIDTGPIIAQASCSVEDTDTEETLAARVLEREHRLYPWVLNAYGRGDIHVIENDIIYSPAARSEASQQQFFLAGGTNEH